MMHSLGHVVYHYGGERSVDVFAHCTEHVTIVKEDDRLSWWASNRWDSGEFFDIVWDSKKPYWMLANQRAIVEISKRISERDFICLIGGNCQKPIAEAFPNHFVVEFGVGYSGIFSRFRVFESYAWMHYLYGQINSHGQFYDTVIPNYYDENDFELEENKKDYLLYIGRFTQLKNVQTAVELSKKTGIPLKIAGQGVVSVDGDTIRGTDFEISGDNIEYVGVVNTKERSQLMANALVVICPTLYVGPFEGVSVESLFCGTPIITTDWGAFVENNIDQKTGFRIRSLGEGLWALKNLHMLWSPKKLRKYAIDKFSIWNVRWQYQEYFEHLSTLWNKGWYEESYTPYRRLRTRLDNSSEF